jgi:hypothetical protein
MADRPAHVSPVHQLAASMPHVKRLEGPKGNSIYQVGGKSFVFFRTPQPDAIDPGSRERYAVLIRASRLAEISMTELTELIQDAWLSRASTKRAAAWLADHSQRSTGALWGRAKPRRINPGQV